MKAWRRVALGGALGLAVGCGPEAQSVRENGLLRGVPTRDAGSPSVAPRLPWRLAEAPSFRVGGADDRPSHQFVEVAAAAVLGDGSVVVADPRLGEVRLYGPDGRFRMRLGSPGDGPGEFRAPSDIVAGPADSIVVWDQGLWRTSVFGPEGVFVRSEPFDPADPVSFPLAGMWPSGIRLGSEGPRLVRLMGKGMDKGTAAAGGGGVDSVGLALVPPGDTDLQLITTLPGQERATVLAPWGPTEIVPPLAAGPLAAMGPGGRRACVGHGQYPEILCVDAEGGRTGVRWTHEPRTVTADDPDVERWRETMSAAYSEKMSPAEAGEVISLVPLPEQGPAFRRLHLDALDHLWVKLGPGEEGFVDYLVLDPDLAVLGRIALPPLEILEIGADHLLGVRSDVLGLQEVVMFPLLR